MSAQYLFSIQSVYLILCSSLVIDVCASTFHWNTNSNFETPNWQRSAQQNGAVCVDIPSNMTLCERIGYKKMRLPNLLNHDSLSEVTQQSTSWVPLSKLNCHPDTKLFLCSLFSPVCLDHPIPPCRSLCESVQTHCEKVMLQYGYPWPEIVKCEQFPIDNDMCIQAQHLLPVQSLAEKKPITSNQHTESKHRKGGHKKGGNKKQRRYQPTETAEYPPMEKETVYEPQPGHLQRPSQLDSETRMKEEPQVDQVMDNNERTTDRPNRKWSKDQRQLYNNIISNFCRSEWILKARLYPVNRNRFELKVRNYRLIQGSIQQKQTPLVLSVNSTVINTINSQTPEQITADDTGVQTQQANNRRRYFIIGKTGTDGKDWVTFIMQWPHKSAQLRKAIKAITNGQYDCSSADNSQHIGGESRLTNANTESTVRPQEHKSRRNNRRDKKKSQQNS